VHAPNLATMTCQLSQSITTSTPAFSSLLHSHRYSTRLVKPSLKISPLLDVSYHTSWSSFHIPHYHSQRLPPPCSNPFDSFLDNVRKVTGSSLQPDFSEDSRLDSEGLVEQNENSFVQLDPNSTGSVDGTLETTFGPLAMLVVGFLAEEFTALQQVLDEIGADEVNLIPCTQKIIEENKMTLGEALSENPQPHQPPSSSSSFSPVDSNTTMNTRNHQKVIFLSGMYTSEVIEVVGALRECDGVPDCAFAAAVPNSWGRKLKELVEDVSADHAAMAERRAQQMAQMEADRLSMEQWED